MLTLSLAQGSKSLLSFEKPIPLCTKRNSPSLPHPTHFSIQALQSRDFCLSVCPAFPGDGGSLFPHLNFASVVPHMRWNNHLNIPQMSDLQLKLAFPFQDLKTLHFTPSKKGKTTSSGCCSNDSAELDFPRLIFIEVFWFFSPISFPQNISGSKEKNKSSHQFCI